MHRATTRDRSGAGRRQPGRRQRASMSRARRMRAACAVLFVTGNCPARRVRWPAGAWPNPMRSATCSRRSRRSRRCSAGKPPKRLPPGFRCSSGLADRSPNGGVIPRRRTMRRRFLHSRMSRASAAGASRAPMIGERTHALAGRGPPLSGAAPLAALFLGMSSGFPYAMIGATLTTRLAQDGIDKKTVTAFTLAFLVYNLKFAVGVGGRRRAAAGDRPAGPARVVAAAGGRAGDRGGGQSRRWSIPPPSLRRDGDRGDPGRRRRRDLRHRHRRLSDRDCSSRASSASARA